MQTLENIKTTSQERFNSLRQKGKEQPDDVKVWGVTAGGAVVGALAVTAVAKGVVAVLSTLAAPPVALTVGAVGGGLLGWNYIHKRPAEGQPATAPDDAPDAESAAATPEAAVDVPVAPVTDEQTAEPADATEPAAPESDDDNL
jgi:hypothetical protein